jgi:RecA-family ATPase
MPERGPAIYVDAEDDADVIHRRLAAVARHYNVTFGEMINGGLYIMSLLGRDAVLATVSRNGKVEATTLYKQLVEAAADIKPKSITIASSANVFTGDENNRTQVTQFVGMLTHVAIVANGSVLLISHPKVPPFVLGAGSDPQSARGCPAAPHNARSPNFPDRKVGRSGLSTGAQTKKAARIRGGLRLQ